MLDDRACQCADLDPRAYLRFRHPPAAKKILELIKLQDATHRSQCRSALLLADGAFFHPDCTVGAGVPDVSPGTGSCAVANERNFARGLTGFGGQYRLPDHRWSGIGIYLPHPAPKVRNNLVVIPV